VAGMMWHWAIFSVPEFAMLLQLSHQRERSNLLSTPSPAMMFVEPAKDEDDEVSVPAPTPPERFRLRRYRAGQSKLVGAATRPAEEGVEVLREWHYLEGR
jgi:hypothetical protein